MKLIACLAALLLALPAHAATLRAKPESLAATLKVAQPGDTVVLDQNRLYGDVVLPAADHAEPVEIVATGAKLRSLMVRGTSGWRWIGGTIDSPLPPEVWRNVMIDNAHRIELAGVTLTGGMTGVLVTRGSSDIVLRGNVATGLRSDGFNIATATRVSLIGNTCRDFRPIPPVYDTAGKMVKDGTHPDCIMLWSEKDQPATSDIDIIGNRAEGAMQGIAHFWHPTLGRDKVYRVRAWANEVRVSYWHGITLEHTPGSDIRFNTVRTLPGATAAGRPDLKVRAWLKADGDALLCGNAVDGVAGAECQTSAL